MAEHFKYEEMTDEELIDQLREGDRQVMDYICDKYKNLLRSKAKSMYILGGDSEDLRQRCQLLYLCRSVYQQTDVHGSAGFQAPEALTAQQLCISV